MKRFFISKSQKRVDDVRIKEIIALLTPMQIFKKTPTKAEVFESVFENRTQIKQILNFADDRLLVIIGPCSIHDSKSALEYAKKLFVQQKHFEKHLKIVMRVYFEKPRTTIGWKGLINDPDLDESYDINKGLVVARKLLIDINKMGMSVGCEFLDMITPQYVADLVSWGAIGARTTESQVHRELASGLSCSIGFKNSTDGSLNNAVDAVKTAMRPHCFLSVTKKGESAIVRTNGNNSCHIILRGGKNATNYNEDSVAKSRSELAKAGLMQNVMVDASHANSQKDYKKQLEVAQSIAKQVAGGDSSIIGVMAESHLVEGRQDLIPGQKLTYGQSITDACVGWDDTVVILEKLAKAVEERRVVKARGN